MLKRVLRLISTFLVLVLLVNMLPMSIFAEQLQKTVITDVETAGTEEQVSVLHEITKKRTQYTKEFLLSNGLHLAVAYPEPVHYEKDGAWEPIDNTLVTKADGTYTNTAGRWQVSFPQQFGAKQSVTITKDGYTLSFGMPQRLTNSGTAVMSAAAETVTATQATTATAQIQAAVDVTAEKEKAEYPETVLENQSSRLTYDNVHSGTDVIYDLTSEKVKESVVLESYDSTLHGFRYTLNVGSMIPVLADEGHITFYDETKTNVIMVMPAPYMVDAAMELCTDVAVTLTGSGSIYTLTYTLPTNWLSSPDRQWPVVLDPVVQASTDTTNIQDAIVASDYTYSYTTGHLDVGYEEVPGIKRTFLKYSNLPVLTSGDVIVSAAVTMTKMADSEKVAPVEVHKVLNTWESETITWDNKPNYDTDIEDYVICLEQGEYTWDVTDLVQQWYATGVNTGMMFKASDAVENGGEDNYKQFYSSDYGTTYKPALQIMFRNSNGLESYWDYTSASAGRAGTGYINNYSGNLVWERTDMGFDGNRMPVTITHYYNANDSQYNIFGMGYGWRTNLNQILYRYNGQYYIWEDGDGTFHYFQYSKAGVYEDEDGLGLTLTVRTGSDYSYFITDQSGNTSYFDSMGRLIRMTNSQSQASSITISYTDERSYWISSLTDGAGRVYSFQYTDYLLTRLSYMGTGDTELSYITYVYSGKNNLSQIIDKDGETTAFAYNNNHILTSVTDVDGYKLGFTYNIDSSEYAPCRVTGIQEYDGSKSGNYIHFTYANNQTTLSDKLGNTQILQFNNWGNTVSVQDDQGHAQYAVYDTDKNGESGKGNQLMLASKLQNTVSNLLNDSSFENDTLWSPGSASQISYSIASEGYLGSRSLYMSGVSSEALYSPTFTAEANTSYTFSGYVKTTTGSVKLGLYQNTDNAAYSDPVSTGGEWTRVQVSYTNDTEADQTVSACILGLDGATACLDCVQVEKATTASRYNLIDNGDFRDGSQSWTATGTTSDDGLVTVTADAPQLDDNTYRLTGDPFAQKSISQTLPISGTAGDSFVVAGWAKGDSVPLTTQDERGRDFAIRLIFNYTQQDSEEESNYASAQFNPDTDSTVRWQYSAVEATAEADYSSVTIQLVYDYNANAVCFDGIQLYKEEFGTVYTYDDSGHVTSVTDEQGQTTTYEYTDNDLTKETLSTGEESSYTYDDYHNLLTEVSSDGTITTYTYDAYGNNTSVTVTGGESGKSITTYASYSEDGNYLVSTTDALGKVTTYSNNSETGVLEWVQYPNDTEATRTNYTYDSMYRMVGAAATTDTGLSLSANYTYTDDQLTALRTPSTTYSFTYGDFSLADSVMIGSRTLVSYTYDEYNRLKVLDYGNDGAVEYTYDAQGNVIKETYEDGATVSYLYDNDGALSKVIDSATGITTTYYYDFSGRLMKYTELGADYSHSVSYTYSDTGNLLSQSETVNGVTITRTYTYDDENRIASVVSGDSHLTYSYDEFGRASQSVVHGSKAIYDYVYTYNETDTTTTQQVSRQRIVIGGESNGFSLNYSYAYDSNGNIKGYTDMSCGRENNYFYDSANQLVRENNPELNKTYTWTYDNAGNILTRNEYAYTTDTLGPPTDTISYTYSDSEWGDLLTAYDGNAITYDAIGNPLSDGTWTYIWKHGRQLSSMSSEAATWQYTYNADGMRIRRTDGTNTYQYVYNGNYLTAMFYGENTLYFSYDANGHPFSVTYNGEVYYYLTNAQGDVIYIVTDTHAPVVGYTYDAWGNLLSTSYSMASTLGQINPLRYRGYVYDNETELYYLQSRYYNPKWGRFINADGQFNDNSHILGANLFAYCNNNPINMVDNDGKDPITLLMCGAITAAVFVITVAAIIMSPKFQRDWAKVCTYVGNSITRGLRILGGAISKVAVTLASKAKIIAEEIAKSYKKVSKITIYRSKRELHHIVAKQAHNASYARTILNNLSIGVNSGVNLVSLKTGLHRRLHTNTYYGWANSVIISAYNSANGNRRKQYSNVIAALGTLRTFLLSMDSVAPY